MRVIVRSLVPALFIFAGVAIGAEGSAPAPASKAEIKTLAASHAAKAKQLQDDYRKDISGHPRLVVEAALENLEAHRLYEQINDTEGVVKSQADLFWCKKQMNYTALQEFIARSNATRPAEPAPEPEAPREAVEPPAPKPEKPVVVAPVKPAPTAEAPPKPVLIGRTARPDERSAKAAFAQVRTTYAKEFARRTFAGKRALGRALIEAAGQPATDPAIRYAMLQEAGRLAQEAEDYGLLGDAADRLDAAYNGINAQEYRRTALRQMKDKPVAQALLALVNDPVDPLANHTVGRYYCFDLRRWEAGLAMCAKGSDPDLKWLSKEDLTNPTDEAHRLRLGDAWYDQAKRAGSPTDRNGQFERAQHWYASVIKTMEGPGKSRVEQRLAEIDKALPVDPDNLDWQNLTPGQWEKLRFPVLTITAKEDKVDAKRILKAGDVVRVVAHPEDRWTFQGTGFGTVTTDWKGVPVSSLREESGLPAESASLGFGAVVCWLEGKPRVRIGDPLSGPGAISIAANRGPGTTATGSIRVKLVPCGDD